MITLRRRILFTLGASLMCAVASPVTAKDQADHSALSDSKLLERYQKAAAAENPDYCKALLPLLGEMAKREVFQQNSGRAKTLTEYQCALTEQRYKDAYALSGELEKITGIALPDETALALAVIAEEYPAAASRVIKMARSPEGSALGKLDMTLFWQLSRELVRNKNSEIRLRMYRALADSPHLDRLNGQARSAIASEAITLDAESGNFSRAAVLMNELQGPYPFLELLANRKLEQIWPALEEIAGPNLQKISEADVGRKAAAYKSNPSDR